MDLTVIRETFFAIHGGRDKLDCWLTRVADLLARPERIRAGCEDVNIAQFPMEILSWQSRPHEVVDRILERIELMGGWD